MYADMQFIQLCANEQESKTRCKAYFDQDPIHK